MRAGFLWLAGFLLLPIAGWPLLSHRSFRRFPLVARGVLSGGVGGVLMSFAMTAWVLLGLRWHVALLSLAAALLAWALRGFLRTEPDGLAPLPGRVGSAEAIAGGLALLAVLAAFVATTCGAAGSPDLLFFWGAKAQQFALARTVDADFLREQFHQYMHSYYPPLVTNLYAFASMTAGRFVWTTAMLTFPLLLGALALGLPAALGTAVSKPTAAATSALTISAIAYLGMEADIGGNGEMPLLFFETLAMALLLSPAASRPAGQLLAGLLLAGAASAKVEGLPFVLSAVVLFVLLRRDTAVAAGKSILRLLAPTVVALGAWFTFGATRKLFFGYSEYGRFLDLHPDHLPVVLRSIGIALASSGHGLPYLVPLLCLLAAGRPTRFSLLPLGVAATLTAFLLFTYIHRAESPEQWIFWSAPRVFSPLAILLALAAAPAPRTDVARVDRSL